MIVDDFVPPKKAYVASVICQSDQLLYGLSAHAFTVNVEVPAATPVTVAVEVEPDTVAFAVAEDDQVYFPTETLLDTVAVAVEVEPTSTETFPNDKVGFVIVNDQSAGILSFPQLLLLITLTEKQLLLNQEGFKSAV